MFFAVQRKGSLLPAFDTGLRRVSVHGDAALVDVTLPAGIPVAVLIPSVVDILRIDHLDDEAWRYRLSLPGAAALDPSMTLAQHGIGDGAILMLSRSAPPLPDPRYFDVAETVSATLDAAAEPSGGTSHARPVRLIAAAAAIVWSAVGGLTIVRNSLHSNDSQANATTVTGLVAAGCLAVVLAAVAHRRYQDQTAGLALSLIATALAAVAGFVTVPGAPGMPNVLLAAAAAGVTAVVAVRLSGCGVVTSTAVASCAVLISTAGLVGVVSAAPLRVVASAAALVSVGLLSMAARASIALAGLSPQLGTPEATEIEPSDARTRLQAVRADRWLTSLHAGLSASATLGAVVTVLADAPSPACIAFGILTGALLLLRSRSTDTRRMLVFATCGILVAATTFGVAAARSPVPGPCIAAVTIMAVAVAMYLGFVGPARPASPVVRRSVGLLELSALTAMVPLTCWIGGLYGAVRGLNLT
ncbi:type VII secretion integral membrane protein EccD [Mycobacterium sp. 852002-51971_SCH5477799-a]|uniref:type VII secretion integral membrane protein EccD n=1 Tax=Mycobacterium sp. 852002-51971_SCH5477799-a TaxID=1834106 RepID=UPI0008020CC0|nr:type VII secretion integral membrane protein EccD [Mycobacterium sp. 852002-51971_SCH5477799-a]OBF63329.1 type VII secretion integral membrane protein EccD [Mycobacterium sp. 852002-51971_SCH5477799-a]